MVIKRVTNGVRRSWNTLKVMVYDPVCVTLAIAYLFIRIGPVITPSMDPVIKVGDIVLSVRTWPLRLFAKLWLQRGSEKAWLANFYARRQAIVNYPTDFFSPGVSCDILHKVSVITHNNKLVVSGIGPYDRLMQLTKRLRLSGLIHSHANRLLHRTISRAYAVGQIDVVDPQQLNMYYVCTLLRAPMLGYALAIALAYKSIVLRISALLLVIATLLDCIE